MPRRMSCSMTIGAVRDRTKDVTRRHEDTWTTLKAGDRLTLIEKGMGLPRGTKQVVLAEVEIVSVTVEPLLDRLDRDEMTREGFPHLHPLEFAAIWARNHGYRRLLRSSGVEWLSQSPWITPTANRADAIQRALCDVQCRRIEWRYLADEVDR